MNWKPTDDWHPAHVCRVGPYWCRVTVQGEDWCLRVTDDANRQTHVWHAAGGTRNLMLLWATRAARGILLGLAQRDAEQARRRLIVAEATLRIAEALCHARS